MPEAAAQLKPAVGRFLPSPLVQALHDYLMTRPGAETFDLIVALRNTKPLTREPK